MNLHTLTVLTSISSIILGVAVILMVGLIAGGPWPRRTLVAAVMGLAIVSVVIRLVVLIGN